MPKRSFSRRSRAQPTGGEGFWRYGNRDQRRGLRPAARWKADHPSFRHDGGLSPAKRSMETDSIHLHRVGLLNLQAGGSHEKDSIAVSCRGDGIAACGPVESSGQEAPVQTMAAWSASQQDSMPDTSEGGAGATANAEKKTLPVCFSPANSDTVDAISSATPRTGDVSSVRALTNLFFSFGDA